MEGKQQQQEKNGTAKVHYLRNIVKKIIFGKNQATRNLNILAIINNDILIDIFTFSSRITLCRLECACRIFGHLVNAYFKTKPYHVLPMLEICGDTSGKNWVGF
jgi:hypothetical protein